MKLVNMKVGNDIRLGLVQDGGILDVQAADPTAPASMEALMVAGVAGQKQLAALTGALIPEDQVVYAPCVTRPEKILCVGLNYKSHREECDIAIPEFPVLFSKFNNALAAHGQTLPLPKSAVKFDYEAELVIVIGKTAANVTKEQALDYVFGYTAGNDLSARDLQFRTAQWLLGKSCDYFAPVGPCLVTADALDPQNLDIRCTVNGEVRQSANTRDMIFDCATVISYISRHMTLQPGDLIFSGTPGGVILGYPAEKQQWLKAGDTVCVSIEKIGELRNTLA
ncbi:MAG TPA: fumarylacetoacetate hydrolase family protein [Patescibacteria group bacterium]|nr:fumarylacetoacetate hydrolase family protein [Patescibacteria group bacterium]